MNKLNALRDHLDQLDLDISLLLEKRQKAVELIGKIKRQEQIAINDPSREKDVLRNVEEAVQHPLLKENIVSIYKMIMEKSKIAQRFFASSIFPFHQVGIIGLGLMGGSIVKALKVKNPAIEIATVLYDNALAVEGGWIDKVHASLESLVRESELIILATPISTIESLASEISAIKKSPLLVMDLASVKESIVNHFEKLSQEGIEYIGTHPMSGREKRGFEHSQATLFVGNPWVIAPHKNNSHRALDLMGALIRYLGSEPVILDASVHDSQAALISHIPGILAREFLAFVRSVDPESMLISGPGFQSFTRLAHDNSEMMAEMTSTNQKNIQNYLNKWREYETNHCLSNG